MRKTLTYMPLWRFSRLSQRFSYLSLALPLYLKEKKEKGEMEFIFVF